MTDQTSNIPIQKAEKKHGIEFWIYFAVIFAVAFPVAVVFATLGLIKGEPARGPFDRAWAKAWEVTPLIFSA